MNRLRLAAISLLLIAPLAARAQAPAGDPVSSTLRPLLERYANNLIASAEEMPVEKYNFHPTPEQMTFGQIIAHVAQVNNFACSKAGEMAAPDEKNEQKVGDTDKPKLVEQLKASMDFCKKAFATLTDARLGEPTTLFRGRQTNRFGAAIEVTNDLIDHYAALAVYLRLSGLLPPTAQPKK